MFCSKQRITEWNEILQTIFFINWTFCWRLCMGGTFLMLDEPTAFLDVDNRIMVLKTLREISEKTGISILYTSHDLHDSLEVCHRVLTFATNGTLFESNKENREEALLKAFPTLKL